MVVRLLLVLCFVWAPFQWMSAQVTLSKGNTTLGTVIQQIQKQTNYKFFYDDDIANTRISGVDVKNVSVSKALESLLAGKDISYTIDDKVVYLKKKNTTQKPVQQGERRKISGQVLDENGEPLIGAVVTVKGTGDRAVTDIDGNYTVFTTVANPVLETTYVGYQTSETAVHGSTANVSMQTDVKSLKEVVVTAMGIKKEAKALSYNVQQVNSDEITGVKDASFMNALAGKVAGVQINASSAGIGGGTKVVMRGNKSISNNNNALYVIDGIPMPSLQTAQPDDFFSGMGQSGDGASMINPDDIESLSVLSGAAASALYGKDAQNGVVMITTKRGSKDRTSVSYSNNTSFFSPFVTPEFQNTYGSAAGEFAAWGAKLGTPSSYDPMDFFRTGYNTTNSVSLSTGNDKNQTFLSLAATNAEGIVENNTLDRYNVSIRNTSSMLNDKLKLDLAAMYMNVRENNMVSEGQYFNPIVPLYLMSPSYSLDTYKLYEMYNAERNFKTQYWPWGNMALAMQNPYWIVNRDNLTNHKNRFMVSGGVTYEIAKGISLAARAKMDYTNALYEKKYSASTDQIFASKFGAYLKNTENTRQIYSDVILNIDKYFGDFSLSANIGASMQDIDWNIDYNGGYLNSVPNKFTLNNIMQSSMKPEQDGEHRNEQAVFATAQLGWKSMLYLDATARNDWAVGMAGTNHESIFYPSIGVSTILTELIPGLKKGNVLSFLKLRASYSEVGNSPSLYLPYKRYKFVNAYPVNQPNYPNSDLEPERTKAWEVGLQSNLWGDKVSVALSLYHTATYNQIFNPPLSVATGYTDIFINGGRVDNKGIELSIGLKQPLGPVNWESNFTYTINRNKIKELLRPIVLEGLGEISQDHLDLISIGNAMTRLYEGGSIGDLYVTALRTDSHGHIYVDYVDNSVQIDRNAGDLKDGFIYAGNAAPKYTMGWRNSFSWNGLTMSCLFTARVGGEGVSMTQALMDNYGTSKASADARDAGGVMINGSKVPAAQKWFQTASSAGSQYVYSMTNVRLAEFSLGYDVPITKVVPFIKGMNVAFTGRNLFMLYCKSPFDPELAASTGTHFDGMDYFMLPSTRNLGFSVKLNF